MAQQTTTMVDDLDDTVTAEETIRFGLDRPGRRPSTRRSAGPVWVQVANRDAAASTRSTDCPPVQVGPRRTPGDQREVTGACFGPFVPVGPSDRSAPGLHPAERAPQLRAARPTPPPSHGRTGLKRTLVLQPHHDSLPRHVPTRSEIAPPDWPIQAIPTWPRVGKPVSYGDELTPASGPFITGRVRASPSSGTLRYRVARLTPRTWATSVTGVFSPIIFRARLNFAGPNAVGRPPRRPRSRAATPTTVGGTRYVVLWSAIKRATLTSSPP